jgi:hypothetical protein
MDATAYWCLTPLERLDALVSVSRRLSGTKMRSHAGAWERYKSDVALLGCNIQIPPNPAFSKGGMRTVSLFGQSAVFVPPLKKGG